jgi:hypothetical protein
VASYTIRTAFGRAESDDEKVVVVVDQLIGGGKSFAQRRTRRAYRFRNLGVELGDESSHLPGGRFQCHCPTLATLCHNCEGGSNGRCLRRHRYRNWTGRPVARGAPGQGGDEGRHRRAQVVRRHLRQHRLHPHQDHGRQRLRRPHGPARSRVRSGCRRRLPRRHAAA